MKIINLSDRPEFKEQVTDWLWQAFGSENSRDFFASVVQSSLSGADLQPERRGSAANVYRAGRRDTGGNGGVVAL